MTIMTGFPPQVKGQAKLENWRTAPYSSWAFHHVREIVPSAEVPNDPDAVWALEAGDALTDETALATALEATRTDALVVLHKGSIAHEVYRHGMTARDPHILMSVSKSMLGLLAGCLEREGLLDVSAPLARYVPELQNTAYVGATVRQALDMRVGVQFDEDYTATSGPIIAYRKAANWNPVPAGETPVDLRGFQSLLVDRDGPHGGRFHYVSPVTDLLGWVFERAAGRRYADLLSDYLWQPLGAERPAYITVDRIGGARAAGGFCVTARDLARVGQLMLQGGARDGVQVIPAAWLKDIATQGDRAAWASGDFAEKLEGYDMCYRSKWYVHPGEGPLIHGLGIHGQYLFVDMSRDLVIAWMSSEADAISDAAFPRTMGIVNMLRNAVTS